MKPLEIIRLYSWQFKIEAVSKQAIHTVGAYAFHLDAGHESDPARGRFATPASPVGELPPSGPPQAGDGRTRYPAGPGRPRIAPIPGRYILVASLVEFPPYTHTAFQYPKKVAISRLT